MKCCMCLIIVYDKRWKKFNANNEHILFHYRSLHISISHRISIYNILININLINFGDTSLSFQKLISKCLPPLPPPSLSLRARVCVCVCVCVCMILIIWWHAINWLLWSNITYIIDKALFITAGRRTVINYV